MPTDNHGLDNSYATGDSFQYNDDMDHIETRLVVRDTEANRSNYTPHSGAIFIATDTGAVYDGDGTNWVAADRDVSFLGVGAHAEFTGGAHGPAITTAENLAGKVGNADGEIRMDDGTNTVARMTPCVWDDVNAVWRPVNDPSTGAFA